MKDILNVLLYIYLTHRFHEPELKPLRGNTAVFILFEQPKKVLEQITRNINLGIENQEFYQLAHKAWRTQKKRNIYSLIQN